jgi:alpha-2-macroglobulin
MAMMLETMMLMGRRDEAVPLAQRLAGILSSDRWLSTQSTAWSLRALSLFLDGEKAAEDMRFTLSIDAAKA